MLSAYWDETHHALKSSLDGWTERHILPFSNDWEEAQHFPDELFQAAGSAGIMGIGYPEELGGSGGDIFHSLVAIESLIRGGSPGTAVTLGIHSIAIPPILALGTPEQQRRWVPGVLSGDKVACLGISEPGAGSDVAGIRTTAQRDGDDYVIEGAKTFITAGTRADYVTLLARTSEEPHAGLTFFVLPSNTPGFRVGKSLNKMGWWASDTAELFFDGCRIGADHRLGDEGSGFIGAMANFATERLVLAANCVAIAQLALDKSLSYAKERKAFGRTIGGFQVTRHKLAEMATKTEAARSFVSTVAARHRSGDDVTMEVAMVKNFAVEACSFVTDAAVQIHGGMGYMRESLVERLYRDARLYPIGGGTTEIMRELIGRRLIG
jgi:acyl-CoA dehydrogenase